MSLTTIAPPVPASTSRYGNKIILIGVFFFIFGFISWINGTLIPYLRIACELEEWQGYLVTFAFYISYTVMAIPSSALLQQTGMVRGMSVGLVAMAVGCLIFVPAAYMRFYPLFLLGLFVVGIGLTVLQTAVNPYITLLGPAESAARRISIMGICNKVAGILAPLVMGSIILNNADGLIKELAVLSAAEKSLRLDILSQEVIVPYCILASILLLIAWGIRFAHLPEVKPESTEKGGIVVSMNTEGKTSPAIQTQFVMGFTAIFCAVGSEVLAGDSIGNYGLYHGIGLDTSKNFTSLTLATMMVGYVIGVCTIPKYISQQKAFWYSSWIGLIVTVLAMVLPGVASVVAIACLGFANAMLWPAIWPQALKGLQGRLLNRGSAILIMGILGGAILPLVYGWLAKYSNNQVAYGLLIPVYLFLLYYSRVGKRQQA